MSGSRYRALFVGVVFILLPMVFARCGGQAGTTNNASADGQVIPPGEATDGLVVTFGSEPNPPAKGDNMIEVTVRRPDGTPVTDATITAAFSMPAMPSMNMPAMRTDASLQHQGEGHYRGTSQLSMGGTWNVAVSVSQGGNVVASRRTSVVARE